MLDQIGFGGVRVGREPDHGAHRLAEPRVRHAEDQGVVHGRVGLQRLLDLFRIDLLAAGIDAVAAAAQEVDRAVGVHGGVVAG